MERSLGRNKSKTIELKEIAHTENAPQFIAWWRGAANKCNMQAIKRAVDSPRY